MVNLSVTFAIYYFNFAELFLNLVGDSISPVLLLQEIPEDSTD